MIWRTLLPLVAFVTGVCLLQLQPTLPPCQASLALLLPAAGLAIILRRWRPWLLTLACLAAGFGWANWRAELRLADRLPSTDTQRVVTSSGHVAGLPQASQFGSRFIFVPDDTTLPRRIQVNWYRPAVVPMAGERWQLTLRLKPVHGAANPAGFDLERWLLQQDVGATASVQAGQRLPGHALGASLDRARAALAERIRRELAGQPYAAVIVALVVGEQSAIPPDLWQRFAATGVTHLVSISGLHITLVSGLVALATGALWRRLPRLAGRTGAPRARLMAGMLAASVYSALAGFAVPTQRTLLMLLIAGSSLLQARRRPISLIWLLALSAVVVLDPFAVLAPGFWLSFLTVGALLWLSAHRLGPPGWLRGWAGTQWAATLASFPLLLFLFQQLPLVSPLANAVAIPLVSLLVTPLALLGTLDPSGYLLLAAERLFALTDWLLGWLAALPHASITLPAPPLWTLLPAAIGVLLLLLPAGIPGRALAPVFLLPMLMPRSDTVPDGQYRLTVFDVGQGLAVLVQTRNHALLYDTGPPGSAERQIVPSLRAMGVSRLDRLVVSHDDNDHAGGADAILASIPVRHWLSQLPATHPARDRAVPHQPCTAGQRWQWDGVRFDVLWPPPGHAGASDNARSCVLRISNGRHAALLPGDIGRSEELQLVRAGLGPTTLLVAPHHGSRSSSSEALLAATAPDWVAYSAGYLNRFRHPNRVVVARYAAHGARALRTDEHGALRFDVGTEVHAQGWRARVPRYWHWQPPQ